MINSRDLNDLHPTVRLRAEKFLALTKAHGIDLLVTCTHRDNESQKLLYAEGRLNTNRIVTRAKPGESFHNYRMALDVVPLRNGKPVWGVRGADLVLWKMVGEIGKSCGFEWGGDWKDFKEFPHFQYTNGLTISDLKAGRTL